jgi:hypothetical protein
MAKLKKELLIYLGLLIFLSLGMHMNQWISHPLEHIKHLSTSQFGPFHPLFFTFAAYLALLIIRFIIGFIIRLFSKRD